MSEVRYNAAASTKYLEPHSIRTALTVLHKDEPFEIRIIKGREVLSGYFDDPEKAVESLKSQNLNNANVYVTLHKLHPGCIARLQYNCFLNTGKDKIPTTSDADVIMYKYIPIDLDPVRPAGISSSYEELKSANELRKQVQAYMKAQGFHSPIIAFSGNGYHLLYYYEIKADEEGKELIKGILSRLDERLSNDACHVDTTNFNPARIFKLYGTLAQKGRSTSDRPHRMSRLLEV